MGVKLMCLTPLFVEANSLSALEPYQRTPIRERARSQANNVRWFSPDIMDRCELSIGVSQFLEAPPLGLKRGEVLEAGVAMDAIVADLNLRS